LLEQVDLESSGFGLKWGHTRSYANRSADNAQGVNGSSWMLRQWKALYFQGGSGGPPTSICVVDGPFTSLWFDLQGESTYTPAFGTLNSLVWNSGLQQYVLTDPTGESWVFADQTVSAALQGKLLLARDPAQQVSTLSYNNDGTLAVFSQSADGRSSTYQYSYVTLAGGTVRMASVTQVLDGENVKRVVFTYYSSGDAGGDLGDLSLADVQVWDAGSLAWLSVKKSHYRYYHDGDTHGFAHGLKYAIQPVAFEQMNEAGLDPLRATESELATFADYYFEYNSDTRVTLERVNGGNDEYSYDYLEGVSPANWAMRCTESRPDGSTMRVYSNSAGEPIATILTEAVTGRVWNESYEYDSNWNRTLYAHPSAVNSVSQPSSSNDPLLVGLNLSNGLIEISDYYSSTDPDTGAVAGRLFTRGVKMGADGPVENQYKFKYVQQTAAGQTIDKFSTVYNYPVAGMADADAPTTSYAYTWLTDGSGNPTLQVAEEVRTLPVVSTDQNGTGDTETDSLVYDSYGHVTWEMNARGVITYRAYVTATGALLQLIQDVDTSRMSGVPSGWGTLPGFGLHLVTDYESDAQGRITLEMGPWHEVQLDQQDTQATAIRTVQYAVYDDVAQEVRQATGWMRGSGASLQFNTLGGVRLTCMDAGGNVVDQITSARECSCGPLTAQEPLPQCRWSRWTHQITDAWGRLEAKREYFAIPCSAACQSQGVSGAMEGEAGINYNETLYFYDHMGRRYRTLDATATIDKLVLDARDLVLETWVGTLDAGTSNLVMVQQNIYDGGSGGGDGLLTQTRLPVDDTSGNDRVVDYTYDYRGNQITRSANDGTRLLITATDYDNLNHLTQVTDYHDSIADANRTRRSRRFYDALARVYRREIDGVSPTTGDITQTLAGQSSYDAVGNIIKASDPGRNAFTKTVYDGLNRVTAGYLCCVPGSAGVPTGCTNDVSTDTVLEQNENVYDAAGSQIETRLYRRLDTATGTGALLGPDGDQPQSRITYKMTWPDAIGRPRNLADYGTNGGSMPAYPGVSPARSDTILVTTTLYKDSGDANRTIDPMGIETHWENDHLGRRVRLLEGITAALRTTGNGCTLQSSQVCAPRVTQYAWHASGELQRLVLINPTTGNQTTRWVFGTTLEESGIASNRLVRAKIYPESDDRPAPLDSGPDGVYSRLEYTYNRQSDVLQFTDADGTVHAYGYDGVGRQVDDSVPVLAAGLSGAVLRISRAYDNRGLLALVTSHDAVTGGSIVNQIALTYGPFGELVTDVQAHSGAVDGSTPVVGYAYTDGSGNTLRRTSVTYPNGRQVSYVYGDSLSIDDLINRISAHNVEGEGGSFVEYTYAGAAWQVELQMPPPNLELTYKQQTGAPPGDAGDIYSGYDRFGRTQEILWLKNS